MRSLKSRASVAASSGSKARSPYRIVKRNSTIVPIAGVFGRCPRCGKDKNLWARWKGHRGQRVCSSCDYETRSPIGVCAANCTDTPKVLRYLSDTGERICAACHRKLRGDWGSCSGCGNPHVVRAYRVSPRQAARLPKGPRWHPKLRVCAACYRSVAPPTHHCEECGKSSKGRFKPHPTKLGKEICGHCHPAPRRKKTLCAGCNRATETLRIPPILGPDAPKMCPTCIKERKLDIGKCGECGEDDVRLLGPDPRRGWKVLLCFGCVRKGKPRGKCGGPCRRKKVTTSNTILVKRGGRMVRVPACRKCYLEQLLKHRVCAKCRDPQRIAMYRNPNGAPESYLCSACWPSQREQSKQERR